MSVSGKKPCLTSIFLSFTLIFSSCASTSKNDGTISSLSSREKKEIALGNEIHQEIMSAYYLYTEPEMNAYVSRIGKDIAKNAGREIPYEFVILVSEKVFATSAPGGKVYITTGFINYVENEAELAGILAHEIGQLQYKDPRLSNSSKAMGVVEVAAALVGGFFGIFGVLAFLGVRGINVLLNRPVADKEKKASGADEKALEYMAEAGYDPQGLIDLFFRVASTPQEQTYLIYDYIMARPIDKERVAELRESFEDLDLEGKSYDVHRDAFMSATRGVREMHSSPITA